MNHCETCDNPTRAKRHADGELLCRWCRAAKRQQMRENPDQYRTEPQTCGATDGDYVCTKTPGHIGPGQGHPEWHMDTPQFHTWKTR